MRTVDIVYLYEHADRELDVACAITAILESRYRVTVEIIQWPMGFPEAVARIRPRMVLLPFCYSDESYRMMLAYWQDALFMNLSWEQLFYVGNRKAKTPRGEFSLNHVVHHAWSESYEHFLKEAGVKQENIVVNGNLAYALYDEPYRHYFASRRDLAECYRLDVSLPWVFFPENYNWAFYSEATIQAFITNGQSVEDIQVMREYCENSLAEMIRWCRDALQDSKVEIILRPRPSTPLSTFMEFVRGVVSELPAHFKIIQQESVREWILSSDIVISSHSTSLIEAAIAGKKTAIVNPYPIPSQLHVDWHDLLPRIDKKDDFIGYIRSAQPLNMELAQWARSSMMKNGDAIASMASHIVDLLQGRRPAPLPFPREIVSSWFNMIPPVGIWSLYRRLKLFLRFPGNKGLDPKQIRDYFPKTSIRARIQKWAELLISKR